MVHIGSACRQVLRKLEALGGTTEHVVHLAIAVQTADDLVLRRHVQLLHHFVQFLAQFDVLCVQSANLSILLTEQELQVLHLVRRLSTLSLPLKISSVCMLTVLD